MPLINRLADFDDGRRNVKGLKNEIEMEPKTRDSTYAYAGGAYGISVEDDWAEAGEGKQSAGATFNHEATIDTCRQGILQIEGNTTKINNSTQAYIHEVNQEKTQASIEMVNQLSKDTARLSKTIKERLDAYKEENDAEEARLEEKGLKEKGLPGAGKNSTVLAWRKNEHRTVARSLKHALLDYKSATKSFQTHVVKRTARMFAVVKGGINAEEVKDLEQRIEKDPVQMQRLLSNQIEQYGISEATVDRIAEIEEQNTKMKEVEQSLRDLQNMFDALATLVDDQGMVLDMISHNVENTKDHVALGRAQLDKAENHTYSYRRRSLYICFCCVLFWIIFYLIFVYLEDQDDEDVVVVVPGDR